MDDDVFGESDSPQPIASPRSGIGSQSTTEPIIGWRQWRITDLEGDIHLGSMTIRDVWPTDLMVGDCRRMPGASWPGSKYPRRHAVPDLACTCGVYAHKLYEPGKLVFRAGLYASGPVALSGRVIEGARGFRAERGRIMGPLSLGAHCPGARRFRSVSEGRCDASYPDGRTPEWVVAEGRRIVPMCEDHLGERLAERRYDPGPMPGRPLQPRGRGLRVLLASEYFQHVGRSLEARYGVAVHT